METFEEKFSVCTNGTAIEENVFLYDGVRITVLTSELIRIERQADGNFCDLPTQTVWFRSLEKVDCSAENVDGDITVKTSKCSFIISENGRLKKVRLSDGRIVTNFKKGNLKGTRRTLDMTYGKVRLEDGIVSRFGVAVMDDSKSLIIKPDGSLGTRRDILGRTEDGTDKYVFAYGCDYRSALRDYYRITGSTPLIPRYCLGNWWSRYREYTQEEYLSLMDKFAEKKIPLTVACVDMDWHWTDCERRFGSKASDYPKPKSPLAKLTGSFLNPGWTGYSWNTELFPDHIGFLDELHRKGLKVNLNVHPAQGVRFFEDCYPDFAEFMEVDKAEKEAVKFDFTDKKYIYGHFKFINEPLENEGVDFWWIDWQQGRKSKIEGLDPLWLLNHYYCLDRQSKGQRPLTLSRFAGYGSHRYPLGFSGDTAINWSVLNFQPYFTAAAANAGYSWWSHDIGGHHFGRKDDELYLRWLQFGVFSPIMRLHSTKDPFMGKEPWNFSRDTERTAADFLRLRHRMIPYTYSMNRLTEKDGIPLVMPIYYAYPEDDEAYTVGNEYFFGTQLIAAPITEQADRITKTASAEVWLPEGRYTDIFTGRIYRGGRKIRMCRDMSSVPVLAVSGAIIPLDGRAEGNDCGNPDKLCVWLYRGNGSFTLYEDDGETLEYKDGKYAETLIKSVENGSDFSVEVKPAVGEISVIPERRDYRFEFRDIVSAQDISACSNGDRLDFVIEKGENGLAVSVRNVSAEKGVLIKLFGVTARKNPSPKELFLQAISKIQGDTRYKTVKYKKCFDNDFNGKILAPKAVRYLLEEITNME